MSNYADLHLHTVHSDGTCTPREVVGKAIADGVSVISITDHDSVGGVSDAIFYADKKIQVIPGIELSAEIEGADIHILGYFMDYKNKDFLKQLEIFKDFREKRARKIVEKLQEMSLKIDYDYVKKIAGEGVIGRLHIAVALNQLGHVRNIQESFEKYIGDQGPCYVSKYKMSPKEAIDFILKYGGISVWAHPGCSEMDHLLEGFVKDGLRGIEVHHPRHSEDDIEKYLEFSRKYNLLVTGGTDFHGKHRITKLGDFGIDKDRFKLFFNASCR